MDIGDLLAVDLVSVERFTSDKDREGLNKEAKMIFDRMPYGGFRI